jgi:hypothetical protein
MATTSRSAGVHVQSTHEIRRSTRAHNARHLPPHCPYHRCLRAVRTLSSMRALALAVAQVIPVRACACGVWRVAWVFTQHGWWLVLQASGTQLEQQELDQHAKHKQVTRAQ